MLWNVTIHDLLSLPLPPVVTVQAYADDIVIVVPAETRDRGDPMVGRRESGIREKTFCVLFPNGHRGMGKNRPPIRISRADRSLAYKDAMRILGVVFDSWLSFFKHADHLREKVELTGDRLRPEQKTSLYRNVFLPGVTYVSPVWWDKLRPDCRLSSRVVSIQRAALLGLLGAYCTTRTTALQVLLNAPPLALQLEQANAEYDLVVRRRQISCGEVSFRPDEILPPVDVWQDHLVTRMSFQFRRLTQDGAPKMARASVMHVYTDGSFSDRLAGAAFVVLGPNDRIGASSRYRVDRATSAYCAEVIVLTQALRWVRDRPATADVRVDTDCRRSKDRTADSRVYSIKTILRKIAARTQIWMYHVPGHWAEARRALLTPRAVRAALRGQEKLRLAREWSN
ncbi:hypothetical protein HPB50_009345 [Hyalomma asiaticum]|uniref:Uncharacterized protein n=1 Tax=Hyalomma asiaticum TaxID=266040 RepID=A0ACB7T1T8_HYAAI|nr:hypothetical protein HPB50_009345 [Hyalomma asiaticum]